MAESPLGFIGFGEAGYHLAKGLRGAGAPPLAAFDIRARDDSPAGARIRARAAETGTVLADSPAALARQVETVISVVTAASALDAARAAAPHLTAAHLYADGNSVSPETKRAIGGAIGDGPGRFVEAAILAPVPGLDHRVPILLNGPAAAALAARLTPLAMRVDVMDAPIGAAAAVKMCRSIVIKGMEALLLECTVAAGAYGATDRVFASLAQTYPGMDWPGTAAYMIGRVLEHGERRSHEMDEVADTLRTAGIEPIMAEATSRRQSWEARLRQTGRLNGPRPHTAEALLALLIDRPGKD